MNGKPDVGNGGIASDTSDSAAIESSPISSSSSSPNYKQESDDHDNICDIDNGANQQHPKGQDDKKENLQRVVRFLQHPAVLGMSKSTKDAYLHSKGVSDELIQTAREHDEKEEQEQNTLMSSTGPDGRKNISDGNNNNDDDNNPVEKIWKMSTEQSRSDHNNKTNNIKSSHYNDRNYTSSSPRMQDTTTMRTNQQQPLQQSYQHDVLHQDNTIPNNYNQQQQQPQPQHHYQQQMIPSPEIQQLQELPNPLVPITVGGFISLFGLAAFRWLNGGDFILFPPPTMSTPTPTTTTQQQHHHHQDNDYNEQLRGLLRDDTNSNNGENQDISYDEDDEDQSETFIDALDEQHAHEENINQSNDFSSNTNLLSNDLKNLTLAIEKYTNIQERSMKIETDKKAKQTTNTVMDLLRNHDSGNDSEEVMDGILTTTPNPDEIIDRRLNVAHNYDGVNNAIGIAMLVQVTEFKCSLKVISEQLNSMLSKSTTSLDSESASLICNTEQCNHMMQKLDDISTSLKKIEMEHLPKSQTSSNSCSSNTSTTILTEYKDSRMDETVETSCHEEESITLSDTKVKNSTDQTNGMSSDDIMDHNTTNSKSNEESPTLTPKSIISDTESSTLNSSLHDDNSRSASSSSLSSKPNDEENYDSVGKEALYHALHKMQESNDKHLVKSCAQMLYLYVSNLCNNPKSKQYRKIYTNNSTYKNKVGNVKFAKDVLYAVGFSDREGLFFEWQGNEERQNEEDANEDEEVETKSEIGISLLQEASSVLKKIKLGEIIHSDT